ncbi:glycosyltransferase family 4 protein [Sulfobacillus harzensis]
MLSTNGASAVLVGGGDVLQSGDMTVVRTPLRDNSGMPTLASRFKMYGRIDSYACSLISFTVRSIQQGLLNDADIVIPINGFWEIVMLRLYRYVRRRSYRIVYVNHAGSEISREISVAAPDLVVLLKQNTRTGKLSPRIPSTVVPNGVSLCNYHVVAPPDRPTLVCVAALIPYKRVDLAIRVAAAGGARLHVYGDGPLAPSIRAQGKNLLGSAFHLTVLPHESMPAQYGLGTALIHTAEDSENFPMVFLESLAANRPVLTFDTATNREILGDAGIYAADFEDMKRLVRTQTFWRNVHHMIADAVPRKRAEKFDWSAVVLPRYMEEFSRLLERPQPWSQAISEPFRAKD